MQVGVEGRQDLGARLGARTARFHDSPGTRLDVPQSDGARDAEEFGVLKGDITVSRASSRACPSVAPAERAVARVTNARRTCGNPALSR